MNPFPSAIRRALLRGLLGLLGAALLAPAAQAQDGKTLRIGFQKYGTLTIVKALGTLDKRLAEQGVTVKWTEFPAGPQLLEGLNVGSIDFGTVGEARRSSPRPPARAGVRGQRARRARQRGHPGAQDSPLRVWPT